LNVKHSPPACKILLEAIEMFIVICREDGEAFDGTKKPEDLKPGEYVLASTEIYASREVAALRNKHICASRQPLVVEITPRQFNKLVEAYR
jgi:hypothetical protein